MKGIFDPYVLWAFDKKLIFWLVRHVRTFDSTVYIFRQNVEIPTLVTCCQWAQKLPIQHIIFRIKLRTIFSFVTCYAHRDSLLNAEMKLLVLVCLLARIEEFYSQMTFWRIPIGKAADFVECKNETTIKRSFSLLITKEWRFFFMAIWGKFREM